jgi:hypothetical protein
MLVATAAPPEGTIASFRLADGEQVRGIVDNGAIVSVSRQGHARLSREAAVRWAIKKGQRGRPCFPVAVGLPDAERTGKSIE